MINLSKSGLGSMYMLDTLDILPNLFDTNFLKPVFRISVSKADTSLSSSSLKIKLVQGNSVHCAAWRNNLLKAITPKIQILSSDNTCVVSSPYPSRF